MSFFDEKKIEGKLQADRQKESREKSEQRRAEQAYAAFARAVAPELELALTEFPQIARKLNRPVHKEELSYFHLRRSGWPVGSVRVREEDGLVCRQKELYVGTNGTLYVREARVGSSSDEMEKINRRQGIELLTRKLWARAKEPAPGSYDAKKIVEDYFYMILGIK